MKPALRVPVLIFALLLTAQHVVAEEWRGIKPLSSTRADVVRMFGDCSDKEKRCEFTFENEDISIDFSRVGNCDGAGSDRVVLIQRVLRDAKTIKALGLDKRHFKSFDPSIPRNRGYRAFVDEESGLLIKTLRGEVFEIYYIAPKSDRHVCPDYYGNIRELVRVTWPHFSHVDSLDCPTDAVAGSKVLIVGYYEITGQRLVPTWITTAGQIVAGQNTRKILLDTTGLAGKLVTVTLEVNDSSQHTFTGSCTFTVSLSTRNF